MIPNLLHGLVHGSLGGLESPQPRLEVYTAISDHIYSFLRNSPLFHLFDHLGAIHVLGSTIGMPDYHYLYNPKLVNRHHQAPDNASEGVGYDRPRVLYNFHVSILDAQGGG